MAVPLPDALAALAAEAPDAPALGDGRERLSRRQLLAQVDALACRLRDERCTTLALHADNGVAWALVALATRAAGVTLLPLPPFFSDEQVEHALACAGPDALLTDAPDRLARWCGRERHADATGLAWWRPRGRPRRHAGCALLTFTSGSTGRPKGVRLPAATLDTVADALVERTRADGSERHLVTLPLGVLLEQVAGLERVLRAGGAVSMPASAEVGLRDGGVLDAAALHDALRHHRASSAIFVPGSLLALVEHLERQGLRASASARFFGVGGASVPAATLRRARRLGLPVYEGYGLTEAGSVVALSAPGEEREGSVGRPLPHVRVEIVSAAVLHEDALAGDGARDGGPPAASGCGARRRATAEGEIVLHGPPVPGVFGEDGAPVGRLDHRRDDDAGGPDGDLPGADDATGRLQVLRQPAPAGGIATGDLGHLDEDGFLFVTGRRKNLFVTSFGRNVSPEWVERRLLGAHGLQQVVVLGEGLPRPVAVLVASPGADPARVLADVERLAASLPVHARPERWLFSAALTAANGFWTSTGRPRRAAIAAAFLPRPTSHETDAVPESATPPPPRTTSR